MPPASTMLSMPDLRVAIQRRGKAKALGIAALAMLVGSLLLQWIVLYTDDSLWFYGPVMNALRLALATLGGLSAMLAPIVGLVGFAIGLYRRYARGSIAVQAGELFVARALRRGFGVPLGRIAEGSVSPQRSEVSLKLRGGDVLLVQVPSAAEGRRLLEAAGVDASRRTLSIRLGETAFLDILSVILGTPLLGTLSIYMTLAVLRIRDAAGWFALVAMVAMVTGLVHLVRGLFGPEHLVIGADGVIVRGGLRTRFVPHERIRDVQVGDQSVQIMLHDGGAVRARARHLTPEEREEIGARIADARRAWSEGRADAAALGRLDRRGRSAQAWREGVRALTTVDAGGYRDRSLTRDDLWRVVESPAASAEQRVGAAIALSGSGSAEEQARIRIAAGACANERLRVALEQAAGGEIEEQALAEAIAAERARR